MTITLTIPDPVATRVILGYSASRGYSPTIFDPETGATSPNPETRAQYAKRMLIAHVIQAVKQYETQLADQAAAQAVDTDIHLS